MDLSAYAAHYVAQNDGSSGYLNQLRWTISALEKQTGRRLRIDELSVELISNYVIAERDKLSPATRRSRRNMLYRLVKAAARDRHLPDRPAIPDRDSLAHVKVPSPIPQAWSIDQVRRLLHFAEQLRGHYQSGVRKSNYWRAWIRCGWDLGWRGCDLRQLRWAWIAGDGSVVVRQQKSAKANYGRLRKDAMESLDDMRLADPVFALPMWCTLPVWRRLAQRLVASAGLPGTIGWLRHSASTNCELHNPKKGYLFAGNTPDVFYKHYFDRRLGDVVQPEEL